MRAQLSDTQKALSDIAHELLGFIVESNGIETYRVSSRIRFRYPAGFHSIPEIEEQIPEFSRHIYAELGEDAQWRFSWVERFMPFEDHVLLVTDSPVLDIRNHIVPSPRAAEERLKDLIVLREHADELIRDYREKLRDYLHQELS